MLTGQANRRRREEPMSNQRTTDWYEARLGRFTASEIWKLMGTPKSKSERLTETAKSFIYEKVAERLTGRYTELFGPALKWGTEHEPMARKFYEEATGSEVVDADFVPYGLTSGGSPDGYVGKDGIVEFKCPFNSANHVRYMVMKDADELPAEYYWQIHGNLLFTGRKWCHFVSFDPRMKRKEHGIYIMTVKASAPEQELIKEKLADATLLYNEIMQTLTNAIPA